MIKITETEGRAIAQILKRRANEVASYQRDLVERISHQTGREVHVHDVPGSVELALSREVERLRRLADRCCPPPEPESDDDE